MNRVGVYFKNEYSKDGDGLYSTSDEHGQYVYSQCEPYDQNQIIPCFDQPDLKATLHLALITPSHWNLIANSNPQFINTSSSQFLHSIHYSILLPNSSSLNTKVLIFTYYYHF